MAPSKHLVRTDATLKTHGPKRFSGSQVWLGLVDQLPITLATLAVAAFAAMTVVTGDWSLEVGP